MSHNDSGTPQDVAVFINVQVKGVPTINRLVVNYTTGAYSIDTAQVLTKAETEIVRAYICKEFSITVRQNFPPPEGSGVF